jgi:hypothetical protein
MQMFKIMMMMFWSILWNNVPTEYEISVLLFEKGLSAQLNPLTIGGIVEFEEPSNVCVKGRIAAH